MYSNTFFRTKQLGPPKDPEDLVFFLQQWLCRISSQVTIQHGHKRNLWLHCGGQTLRLSICDEVYDPYSSEKSYLRMP